MRSWFKAWGRTLGTVCAAAAFTAPIAAAGDDWSWLTRSQSNQTDSATVRKDDSQVTEIRPQADQDEPIYQVANKPKTKKQTSSWNRFWHPSQWFSTSKSNKR
jgi:hypothetical protein